MIRVLYLLNYAGEGGTERYVELLARDMGEKGLVQPFFAYNQDGLLVKRLEAMGVPCRRLEMKGRFDRKAARALAALCREWKIDLIHCHYLREHYIALLAKKLCRGVKVVYTNHIIVKNDPVTRLTNRLLDGWQDQMIAVCNMGKAQLVANGWSGDRIRVVFNGVNPALWAGGREYSTLRRELNIPDDRFVLLCVGRFDDYKRQDFLLRSLKELADGTDTPFTLVLAGNGPKQAECEALAQSLGLGDKVRFLGYRTDVKNLYHGSDLYVSCSRWEALSFVILEAMAAGLPVVATNVGGTPDLVNQKTGCGLLVDFEDTKGMAAAIRRFMEEPELRRQCGAQARQAVHTYFEMSKMVEATYTVYEKALHPGAKE